MSIFKKSFVIESKSSESLSTIKIVEEAASITPFLNSIDPFLKINGTMQASDILNFEIANYNSQATYEVNFGDGQSLVGKSPSIKHTYLNTGKYNVELIMHYKENSNSIFQTRVEILPSNAEFLSSL